MSYRSISGAGAKAPARRYRSTLRRQQAEQTRLDVVTAAAALFAEHGYAGTTLAKIAAAAGVSVETVQSHGPKAALMIAAVEYAAFGETGDRDILDSEIGEQLSQIEDPEAALDYLVALQTELHSRSAHPARALFGGAAVDPTLDRYLDELLTGIKRQMRRVLVLFRERGWLREDLPFDDLVETAALLADVQTYLKIVDRSRWSDQAYRTWLRRMLAETVMDRGAVRSLR
ncbi:TetR/AcrR family transcriptional regulator [Mycobacterium sp. SMC-4]|uniref:TetR/AcrR family transcriptional regulator n=1 Tax=Mycobacterium sp. SMC-4 TaxID=2857059 RepID=UPI0021B2268E|nr:TetR/AcrR family transcriptional regulator [Mycobacterium sp. SMC-4]UXA18962.1 TetR/AcrR family transcriptional regulator [Mycobacterium sp. SMC-4]